MAGEKTRTAVAAQPEWLAQVPTDRRLPAGRVVAVGCGTSFHAAQTAGLGADALEFLLSPPDADVLVLVSHEGETPFTLAAAEAFAGPKWLVTGKAEGPIAALCDEVIVATPKIEESYCHTACYTCAVAALAALRGEDIAWLPEAVAAQLEAERQPVSDHERLLVAGAGRDWPTAQEAALKLREGVYVAAEAHRTRSSCTDTWPRSTKTFAASCSRAKVVLRNGAQAAAALREIGCDMTLVPTRHPVVDIVPFQLLTVDLAEARGTIPI